MPINTSINRPKLNQTNSVSLTLSSATIENDTQDRIFLVVSIDSLDPPLRSVNNITFGNGVTTLTRTAGFNTVLVGDTVTGTGIPTSTTVTAISADGTQITINNPTNAASAAGGETLEFNSASGNAPAIVLDLSLSQSGQSLSGSVTGYVLNGEFGVTALTSSNIETAISRFVQQMPIQNINLDVDAFLDRLGIARTN